MPYISYEENNRQSRTGDLLDSLNEDTDSPSYRAYSIRSRSMFNEDDAEEDKDSLASNASIRGYLNFKLFGDPLPLNPGR
jgi:hypothetical protein